VKEQESNAILRLDLVRIDSAQQSLFSCTEFSIFRSLKMSQSGCRRDICI